MTYKSRVQSWGGWVPCEIENTAKITPHFAVEEIANPSCKEDVKLVMPQGAFTALLALEWVRTQYNKKMPVNSGYRSPSYNKEIGGTPDSLHLLCEAFDIGLGNITDKTFNNFYLWVYAAAVKYDVQAELLRYSWGLHIGFGKLNYTSERIYSEDKRK